MASERMQLRTIVVTTQDALKSMPADSARIRAVAHALLASLEAEILSNGADPAMLDEVNDARRTL